MNNEAELALQLLCLENNAKTKMWETVADAIANQKIMTPEDWKKEQERRERLEQSELGQALLRVLYYYKNHTVDLPKAQ